MKNKFLLGFVVALWITAPISAETARARIAGTGVDSPLLGQVLLRDTTSGLRIDAEFVQVPPGPHGFHIHEFGSCEDAGKAAGGHYNPSHHPHGHAITDGVVKTHAGDFGNVVIDSEGHGFFTAEIPGLSLGKGDFNVAGRSFIIHERADDFSQPLGNAGNRIGCGPILITKD